jgi:hypothetical protein
MRMHERMEGMYDQKKLPQLRLKYHLSELCASSVWEIKNIPRCGTRLFLHDQKP